MCIVLLTTVCLQFILSLLFLALASGASILGEESVKEKRGIFGAYHSPLATGKTYLRYTNNKCSVLHLFCIVVYVVY